MDYICDDYKMKPPGKSQEGGQVDVYCYFQFKNAIQKKTEDIGELTVVKF